MAGRRSVLFTKVFFLWRIGADFLVVLLQRGKIFACLRKLALIEYMSHRRRKYGAWQLTSSIPSPTYQCTNARFE